MGRLDHAHIVPVHSGRRSIRRRACAGSACPTGPACRSIRGHPPGPCRRRGPGRPAALWEVVAAAAWPRAIPCPARRPAGTASPSGGRTPTPSPGSSPRSPGRWRTPTSEEIFHRDVKPANVLLTLRDGPQLLDFNLSHDPHSVGQAEAALRGGTLPYMAPEQLEAFLDPARLGRGRAPRRTCISLGLVPPRAADGAGPRDARREGCPCRGRSASLLDRRADFRVSSGAHNPTIPHALEAIVACCLAYSPRPNAIPSAGRWPTTWSGSSSAGRSCTPSTRPGASAPRTISDGIGSPCCRPS